MKFLILLTLFCGIANFISATNWCNLQIPSKNCPKDFKIVPFTGNLKNSVLNVHNDLRSKTALGRTGRLKPATRMASMTWDDKLAKFAEYNVMQCQMKHDRCHSTKQFPYAGQNLGSSYETNDTTIITKVINSWFGEHNITTMNDINKFTSLKSSIEPAKWIGHFTQVVRDKANKIGCGIARYTDPSYPKSKYNLMACNYAMSNMQNSPIYVAGPTASACKSGKNPRYAGLCSVNEKY